MAGISWLLAEASKCPVVEYMYDGGLSKDEVENDTMEVYEYTYEVESPRYMTSPPLLQKERKKKNSGDFLAGLKGSLRCSVACSVVHQRPRWLLATTMTTTSSMKQMIPNFSVSSHFLTQFGPRWKEV